MTETMRAVILALYLVLGTGSTIAAQAATGPVAPGTDAVSWTYRAAFPRTAGTYRSAACNDGRYYYVVGGYNGTSGTNGPLDTLYRYNPATNTWNALRPLPYPVSNHCAVYHPGRNRIYVVGGLMAGGSYAAYNQEYDIAADTWRIRAALPRACYGTAGAAFGDSILVVCGDPYQGETYRYDIGANTWGLGPARER